MADEPTPQPAPPAEPAKPEPEPAKEQTVPYDRFAAVNEQAKEAKAAQKKLEDRLQELEDKDKSELEQERGKRERLEAELQTAGERLVSLERGGWVRDAAVAANFVDPSDAVVHANLGEIESEADAKKAVKKIADEKKHLVKAEPEPTPQIGRVLANGQQVDTTAPSPQAAENEKFLQELKDASRKGWATSGSGLMDD